MDLLWTCYGLACIITQKKMMKSDPKSHKKHDVISCNLSDFLWQIFNAWVFGKNCTFIGYKMKL